MPDHAYLAFLDILGYRELLQADVTSGAYEFRERMIRAFRVFEGVNQARYAYKAISDSIFISCGDQAAALEFLELQRNVFVTFLSEGLLLRGGISFGAHFQNQSITYSPVLAKAYWLESQVAEFPRVMVDPNIVDMFPGVVASGHVLRSGEFWFLNIVSRESFQAVWSHARDVFDSSRAVVRKNERVRAKNRWLQEFLRESAVMLGLEVPSPYLALFDTDKLAV